MSKACPNARRPWYAAVPNLDALARQWVQRCCPKLSLPEGREQRAVEMWLASLPPYQASHWSWRIVRAKWLRLTGRTNQLATYGRTARTAWGRRLVKVGIWPGDLLTRAEANRAEALLRAAGMTRRLAIGAWDALPADARMYADRPSADGTVCVFMPESRDAYRMFLRDGNRGYAALRRATAHRKQQVEWAADPAMKTAFLKKMKQKARRAGAAVRGDRAALRT